MEIKRNSCARAGINELGQVTVDIKNEALKPIPPAELGECKGEIPAGQSCQFVRIERVGPFFPRVPDQQWFLLPVIAQERINIEICKSR